MKQQEKFYFTYANSKLKYCYWQRPLGGKMNTSKNLYRDILTGIFMLTGSFGFMSGEFVISSVLFCASTISSNLDFTRTISNVFNFNRSLRT